MCFAIYVTIYGEIEKKNKLAHFCMGYLNILKSLVALVVPEERCGLAEMFEGGKKENLHCILFGFCKRQILKSNDIMVKYILYFPFGKIYMSVTLHVLANSNIECSIWSVLMLVLG